MAGLSAYILADTFFISLCAGPDGITLLNLALPLYGLIFALGSMVGIGSATRFALQTARGREDADRSFSHALLWQAVLSLPFVILGFLSPEGWIRIMGGDGEIVRLGRDYIRIVLIAAPVFMANYSFTAFARNDGAPGTAMAASLTASGFNILFDYLFMFPLKMGLAGAALATSMAPAVSGLICCRHYFSSRCSIRLHWVMPSVRELLRCCGLGISAFVSEMSSAVTTTVYNFLLLRIAGNIGVAAYGIVANLSLIALAFFNGIAQGMQPLVSSSYGRGNHTETRQYLSMAIRTALLLEGLLILGAWVFTGPLTGMFNSAGSLRLAEYSHSALRLYFLGYLFAGINIVLTAYFSAVGKTAQAFRASVLRGAVAIVICAVVMARLWGLPGIWLSFLAAEGITLGVILLDRTSFTRT